MSLRTEIDKLIGKNADNLTRLIVINIIVFVIANILVGIPGTSKWVNYFMLPSSFADLAKYPWTIFTYMFIHISFMHLLFNLLWLYWIGLIFADFLGQQRLLYTYILGGFAGGLLYLTVSNIFYPGVDFMLLGASAGIMAVIVAAAMLVPDYELYLLFIGRVKLKYLALAAFILSTVIDFSVNSGGKVSHIGGAIYGMVFMWQYRKGTDISGGFAKLINNSISFFTRKKSKKARPVKSGNRHSTTGNRQKRIDEILDKISHSGYDSLSKEEKEFLFKSSKET